MPLMRYNTQDLWKDQSAAAGAVTSSVDVSKVSNILVYVKVSAATNIYLQIETTQGYITYDTMTFSAAGEDFWNIWSAPWKNMRFKTSAAATITIQVMYKT